MFHNLWFIYYSQLTHGGWRVKILFLPWVSELQLNSAGSCEKEKKVE